MSTNNILEESVQSSIQQQLLNKEDALNIIEVNRTPNFNPGKLMMRLDREDSSEEITRVGKDEHTAMTMHKQSYFNIQGGSSGVATEQ